MTTFHDIINDRDILKAIDDLRFTEPTSIQEETIPLCLEGRDVIGQAKTGSGKTFAFGIPILHNLSPEQRIQAVILVPTRELTQQITRELTKIAKYRKVNIATVYGGGSMNTQVNELKRAHIVVGTPGRMCDHLERGTLDMRFVSMLVLDEADRMLDMGFIEDIRYMMDNIPENRQMMLFSATMPVQIRKLAEQYLHEPEYVKTHSHIEEHYLPQFYYVVEHNRKFSLLYHLLQEEELQKCIIFCGTRRTVDAVERNLRHQNLKVECMHGGLSQAKRNATLEKFRKNRAHILIATDVAARGIDIHDVTHVINYDVPRNPEDYVHRIGRTARAGKSGKALTLLEDRDFDYFRAVLNIVPTKPQEIKIENIQNVGFRPNAQNRRPQGGHRSRGPRRTTRRRSQRR